MSRYEPYTPTFDDWLLWYYHRFERALDHGEDGGWVELQVFFSAEEMRQVRAAAYFQGIPTADWIVIVTMMGLWNAMGPVQMKRLLREADGHVAA